MKLSRNKISKLLKVKEQSRKKYKKNKRQRKRGKSFRGKKHFNIRRKSMRKNKHLKYKKNILSGGVVNEGTGISPEPPPSAQPLNPSQLFLNYSRERNPENLKLINDQFSGIRKKDNEETIQSLDAFQNLNPHQRHHLNQPLW